MRYPNSLATIVGLMDGSVSVQVPIKTMSARTIKALVTDFKVTSLVNEVGERCILVEHL